MSGISSIGSSPASSGTSSSSSSLPNGGRSSVGASLITSGGAPNPVPAAKPAPSPSSPPSVYEKQYQNLITYDNQELLYASFLDPQAALANADSVFEQAATLLGSPGHPGTLQTTPSAPAINGNGSSNSSSSGAPTNVPSVASILAASDNEANKTLAAFANAPVGSSILDVQA